MTSTHPGSARRLVVGLCVAALTLALIPAVDAQAQPEVTEYEGEPGTIVERSGDGLLPSFRYRGTGRHDTARLIATDTETFRAEDPQAFAGADDVIVARADDFPDSLAGTALAGALTAPVLLVDTTGDIQADTQAALDEIEPSTIYALGGPAAISEDVEAALEELDYVDAVERIAGSDRYETAAEVARAAAEEDPVPDLAGDTTALLATGEEFADALAGGQVSYAGPFPLLLTPGDELGPDAEQALADLEIDRVLVLGGSSAVSDDVQASLEELDYDVDRLAGRDRTVTAVEIAEFAIDELEFSENHLNMARGNNFADALAVAPHAGEEQTPLLITATETALGQPEVEEFHAERACTFEDLHVAGGFSAVTPDLEQQIRGSVTGFACDVEIVNDDEAVAAGEAVEVEAAVLTSLGNGTPDEIPVTFSTETETGDEEAACDPAQATTQEAVATCTFETEQNGLYTVTATITTDEGEEVTDEVNIAVGLDAEALPEPDEDAESFQFTVASEREVGEGYDDSPNPLGPAGGDAQGQAQVSINAAEGEVCLSFVAGGVGGEFEAFEEEFNTVPVHVHEGTFDVNGDVVVAFAELPAQAGPFAIMEEACETVDDADLLADMVADPDGYYVNAHTELWPGGNLRGQLSDEWDGEDRSDDEPRDVDGSGTGLPSL